MQSGGIVTIIGRPNVGKSTLFNKLTKSTKAIVHDRPGVTRDRLYELVPMQLIEDCAYTLIDTGGFETEGYNFQPFKEPIVWEQTEKAMEQADLILFVVDAHQGTHPHDEFLLQKLREAGRPFFVVVNKIDGKEKESLAYDFYRLGIDTMYPISAAHGVGVGELKEAIEGHLQEVVTFKKNVPETAIRLALIGRPNAGKSSILNRLCGEERALVSPIAGTTRDSIDALIRYQGQAISVIDTAGIRRKTKIDEALESMSVLRSIQCIDQANIIFYVIDGVAGLTDQDTRLINLATDRGKPVALIINKWDLVPNKTSKTMDQYKANLRQIIKDKDYIPILFISCLENKRVHDLLGLACHLDAENKRRVPTAQVNQALEKIIAEHTPQISKQYSKRIKFYYATQVTTRPPTIVIQTNMAEELAQSYRRYMMRKFREYLEIKDVPLRLIFRQKSDKRRSQLGHAEASQ